MTIENLARLMDADILNSPSISSVLNFSFDARKVTQADAFIAQNASEEEIRLAIANGAYAIISEDKIAQSDKEIAYLQVKSVQAAIFKLARFEANLKKLKFCLVNSLQHAILEHTHLDKNAAILPKEASEILIKILHAKEGLLFFSDDERILGFISPLYESIVNSEDTKIFKSGSIFFTSLIVSEIYYQNLPFPNVFASMLGDLIAYLQKNSIAFKFLELRNLGHFEPIFIDKNFYPTTFGASPRALIAQNDEDFFELCASYLLDRFKTDEIAICLPQNSAIEISNALKFQNLEEIKRLKNFRYALVLASKAQILETLAQNEPEKNLFDF